MSANNTIVVKEMRPNDYGVFDVDVEQQGWGREIARNISLRQALEIANEQESEYGLTVEFLKGLVPKEQDD